MNNPSDPIKSPKSLWGYYPGQIPAELLAPESQEDKKEKRLERFILIMAALLVVAGAMVFFLAFFVLPGYIAEKL